LRNHAATLTLTLDLENVALGQLGLHHQAKFGEIPKELLPMP